MSYKILVKGKKVLALGHIDYELGDGEEILNESAIAVTGDFTKNDVYRDTSDNLIKRKPANLITAESEYLVLKQQFKENSVEYTSIDLAKDLYDSGKIVLADLGTEGQDLVYLRQQAKAKKQEIIDILATL